MLTTLDKSNYLKGLLILAKKDKSLFETEKSFIRDVAQRLGFSRDFYEDTLRYLMSNRYIEDGEVSFSNKNVAELFLGDGLALAYSDDKCGTEELEWLRRVADKNGLSDEEFNSIYESFSETKYAG